MIDHFDEIQASAYSVSLFWQGETINQVWLKQRDGDLPPTEFFSAKAAEDHLHPIPGVSAIHCTPQMGIVGAWHECLPHFKMNFTPSSGDELQSEYFVPRAQAQSALHAIRSIQERIAPLLLISEVRTIAADDLWMSPCYQQESVAIHFTWKPLWAQVREVLPLIEEQLRPFEVRPHWGKLFTMTDFHYEKMDDFRQLVSRLDPDRKFSNAFLRSFT
jgi:xylitol oxidase